MPSPTAAWFQRHPTGLRRLHSHHQANNIGAEAQYHQDKNTPKENRLSFRPRPLGAGRPKGIVLALATKSNPRNCFEAEIILEALKVIAGSVSLRVAVEQGISAVWLGATHHIFLDALNLKRGQL